MHMLKLVKLERKDMPKLLYMMDERTASYTRGTGLILDELNFFIKK